MFNLPCQVINAVVPAKYLDDKTIYHLQPSGRFVIGGPQVTPDPHALYSDQIDNTYLLTSGFFLLKQGDAGVTGRKIIVDTYGGWGAHGGGAFSGKDFSKVDRSAAYAARWVAKSLVKAKLCRRVLVQVRVHATLFTSAEIQPYPKDAAARSQCVFVSSMSPSHRCPMPSEWPSLSPSLCSLTVLRRKQSQSCSRLSTRTLTYGQVSLSGRHFILRHVFSI